MAVYKNLSTRDKRVNQHQLNRKRQLDYKRNWNNIETNTPEIVNNNDALVDQEETTL